MNVGILGQEKTASTLIAIAVMIAATAMWGVSFVAPLVLDRYSPIQITFGRFFFYGIVSIVIWLSRYRQARLSLRAWGLAMAYGLAGNVLFSVLVSFGIQDTGAEVCIPIIGLLPICVSVFGNYRLAEAPWRQMILPLTLIVVGLALILTIRSGIFTAKPHLSFLGILAVTATVCIWSWYAISNARFLRANPDVSSGQWACAIGITTFILACGVSIPTLFRHNNGFAFYLSTSQLHDLPVFLALTAFLGVGASWLAAVMFNNASSRLPMSLVGQLIVLETLFGILYVCIYKSSVPPTLEFVGMCAVILGIWLSTRALL